jgi:hypothetical protein
MSATATTAAAGVSSGSLTVVVSDTATDCSTELSLDDSLATAGSL